MKQKIKTLFLGLLISSSAFSQNIPSYVPSNGLVGYWGLDGNAKDASSNANHGVIHNATPTTDRYGKSNSAFQFSGNDNNTVSYIATGFKNLPSGNTPRTISAWVTHDTYGGQGGQGNEGHPIFGYGKPQGNQGNEVFFAKTSGNKAFILYGGYENDLTIDFTYTTKTWYHIVALFDGTTAKLYANNNIIGSSDKASWNTTLDSLFIGSQCNKMKYHNGKIDELGIWNRALTTEEINKLYVGCVNPVASITPSSSTTFCQGNSVVLAATTGANYTYEWYKNNNLLQNENQTNYTVNQTGNYSVKITDGSCNSTSSVTIVTVNPNPTVTLNSISNLLTSDNAITLVGSPTGGVFSGKGVIGEVLNPKNTGLGKKTVSYTYTTPQGCSESVIRTFVVSDTLGNVCTSTILTYDTIIHHDTIMSYISTYDTLKIKVNVILGNNNSILNTLTIYPNPTKEYIIIKNEAYSSMNGYSISIKEISGKEVYNQKINTETTQIDLSSLGSRGIYILYLKDDNNITITDRKIVLE